MRLNQRQKGHECPIIKPQTWSVSDWRDSASPNLFLADWARVRHSIGWPLDGGHLATLRDSASRSQDRLEVGENTDVGPEVSPERMGGRGTGIPFGDFPSRFHKI